MSPTQPEPERDPGYEFTTLIQPLLISFPNTGPDNELAEAVNAGWQTESVAVVTSATNGFTNVYRIVTLKRRLTRRTGD